MAQRFLIDGALESKFAELFGGKFEPVTDLKNGPSKTAKTGKANSSVRLLDENLKFGSMPTHPLGATKSFSAT
jgi:hypothetical protein